MNPLRTAALVTVGTVRFVLGMAQDGIDVYRLTRELTRDYDKQVRCPGCTLAVEHCVCS